MNTSRREFLKTTAVASAGAALLPSQLVFADTKTPKVRLGFIGVGLRGQHLLELALRRDDVDVPAICDIQPTMIEASLDLIKKSGKPAPRVIQEGPRDYQKLLAMKDIDAVIIATPWEWHAVMSIDAMNAGKYVGCEVIAGTTVEECWDLVDTSERTGMPMMMLENVCYRRDVMAVLKMVRQGLFGEIVHLQAGYQHDLREVKFNNGKQPYGGGVEFGDKGYSEARWRTQHSVMRNGDLYPTHGIGPVAMMIDINRGNRFVSLCSYASKTRGLHEHIVKHGGADHPNAKIKFKLGDVVTTMIKTNNEETVLLQHDTSLPRPYSLGFRVQGTKGLWMDVNKSLYLEGVSKEPHRWEEAAPYLAQYDHPLWKRYESASTGAGHGGMDFFVMHAFIESAKRRTNTPLDVYDAAAWSAIAPLSETSIQLGGETMAFPDFTRGKWLHRGNTFAQDDQY